MTMPTLMQITSNNLKWGSWYAKHLTHEICNTPVIAYGLGYNSVAFVLHMGKKVFGFTLINGYPYTQTKQSEYTHIAKYDAEFILNEIRTNKAFYETKIASDCDKIIDSIKNYYPYLGRIIVVENTTNYYVGGDGVEHIGDKYWIHTSILDFYRLRNNKYRIMHKCKEEDLSDRIDYRACIKILENTHKGIKERTITNKTTEDVITQIKKQVVMEAI